MKKLLYLVLAGLLAACSAELSPGDVAAQAAKVYYEYLLKGDYAAFVDGHYRQDSIPRSYREQLITNAKMFVGQQQTERRGLKEVRIVRAEADTALHVASVFMLFTYGDSTNEEVLVPMVEHKGVWYLR
ncbi:hypothetical protein HMPREF0663_10080 [Hoylesella oralis ATCC 33269]|uniref:DUF4878 domain-containing protein n=1 Tax=Hoylesella oralis ATCC 33269 TaxID=873533 RepID=E7RLT0_9BACT|nr:hypothetical protein [Hoylesella oralis]EFZ37711.1 hypothetical protein HMPREF0663_10080 [Hoylesella oralis ATCC 33269]EPH16892.1 hypothetical protein HMPREF1475_01217 [Hoylesella oralis HGA0225]SHF47976.1 hypothetical protein SAMN05444288_0760 [Hoylesella oralis]